MQNSRSKNAILNIIVGFVTQLALILMSFIGRKIFVYYLELDYLGINGLYGNILSVLSLAELGLGNVTQYFLYKPVAEKNEDLIRYLVKYFKKLYTIIAFVVLGLGLFFIPVLKYIINSNLPERDLIIYYVIFLLNSVVSYFSAHKIALLSANQDNRLQKYIMLITNVITQILYIVVLILFHNYMFYVSITLLSTVINVVLVNVICDKRYPYLLKKTNYIPNDFNKKYIINNVKSTFLYKIGAVIVNNTDNILISMIVSTSCVGLYSNYYMVVSAIQGFIAIITTSLISGIGNLSATGNNKRINSVFNTMLLFYHLIAAIGFICFFFLFEDLISLWLGSNYVLNKLTTFSIAFSFYLTNAISPTWMFREANGLFNKVKYLLLSTAIINIILSILLGNYLGMAGILLATSIARILTMVWYEPNILYKNVLCSPVKLYWKKQIKYLLLTCFSFILCLELNMLMPHNFYTMIVKAVLYSAIIGCVFILFVRNDEEFVELKSMLMPMVQKLRK